LIGTTSYDDLTFATSGEKLTDIVHRAGFQLNPIGATKTVGGPVTMSAY
jgi:hypothetical protein